MKYLAYIVAGGYLTLWFIGKNPCTFVLGVFVVCVLWYGLATGGF